MRFIATIFLLFVLSAVAVPAQCPLANDSSPALVNVKLGMSQAEVNSALRGALKVKVKGDGQVSIFKSYLKKGKAKGVLSGARAFYLRFYEQRLYQIEIFYHKDYRWSDLESFVRDYSAGSGFGFENFEIRNGYAKAECDRFSVEADYILNPHIEITDIEALGKVNDSKNEKEGS